MSMIKIIGPRLDSSGAIQVIVELADLSLFAKDNVRPNGKI